MGLVSKFLDKETSHASIHTSKISWHDSIVTPYFCGGVLLAKMMPGDPFAGEINPSNTNPQYIEEMREKLGYNDPIIVQYGRWVSKFIQGDFGKSTVYKNRLQRLLLSEYQIQYF